MFKIALAAALALAAAVPAAAVSYSTSDAQFNSIGDSIGSQYDQLTLGGVTGNFTGPGTYTVNTVSFLSGYNSNSVADYGGTFTNTATFGGGNFSYAIPYTIHIDNFDTITLGGNGFTNDGYRVHLNTLTLNTGTDNPSTGTLTATVSVPEPATWAMMLAGFGLVGFGLRRRTTAVAA